MSSHFGLLGGHLDYSGVIRHMNYLFVDMKYFHQSLPVL